MANGFLIDNLGNSLVRITEREHEELSLCLAALRAKNPTSKSPACEILEWFLFLFKSKVAQNHREIFSWMAFRYLETHESDSVDGMLIATRMMDEVYGLDATRLDLLRSASMLAERGGWFAEWLEAELPRIAKGKTAAERAPTPLEVMGSIAHATETYDCEFEIAQRMIDLRPDLFPQRPEEPPATETVKPTRKRKKAA